MESEILLEWTEYSMLESMTISRPYQMTFLGVSIFWCYRKVVTQRWCIQEGKACFFHHWLLKYPMMGILVVIITPCVLTDTLDGPGNPDEQQRCFAAIFHQLFHPFYGKMVTTRIKIWMLWSRCDQVFVYWCYCVQIDDRLYITDFDVQWAISGKTIGTSSFVQLTASTKCAYRKMQHKLHQFHWLKYNFILRTCRIHTNHRKKSNIIGVLVFVVRTRASYKTYPRR